MARVRREIPAGRRARQIRHLDKRILVVCGSRRTEKQYLEGLRDSARKSNIAIKIRIEPSDPMAVVSAAVDFRDADRDAFDECWVVLDVDEFDIPPVLEYAAAEDIRVALSNPCFEYWLLLHFCEFHKHVASYKAMEPVLKKYVPGYDKARIDFQRYKPHVLDAVERSARRLERCRSDLGVNPITNVHLIVEQFLPGTG